MALPKTFVSGERLFASDLNDNYEYLETAVDNAGPDFETAGSDAVQVDLVKDKIITRSAAGDITFTGTNYTAGKSATVRVICDATDRNLTFPAGWKFVSYKPPTILADKTAVLSLTAFGTTEASVVASWATEV